MSEMNEANGKLLTFSGSVIHGRRYTRPLSIERGWLYALQILNSKRQIGNHEIGLHTPEICWVTEITLMGAARYK
jgi:hypothetical protein